MMSSDSRVYDEAAVCVHGANRLKTIAFGIIIK